MDTQAIEGLPHQRVLAKRRLATDAPTAVGAGTLTHGQRETVNDRERRIRRELAHNRLPDQLFEPRRVRRLADEAGAVQRAQRWGEVGCSTRVPSKG